MLDTGHPSFLWLECATYACLVRNFTPTAKLNLSPYAAKFGKEPNLALLKPWGCLALAKIDNSLRTKLDPQSNKGWFVGVDIDNMAYRIWFPSTNNVLVRREVRFMEDNRGREGIDSIFNQEEVKLLCEEAFEKAKPLPEFIDMPPYRAEDFQEDEAGQDVQIQEVPFEPSDSDSPSQSDSEEEPEAEKVIESHHGRPIRNRKPLRLPDFLYDDAEAHL